MSQELADKFVEKLGRHLKKDVEVVLNENRTHMLTILQKTRNSIRLSLHQMFLKAPERVVTAIAQFIERRREARASKQVIRGYIQENMPRLDYSHLVKPARLVQVGKVYHLQEIYDRVNRQYFEGKLALQITWYGRERRKGKRRRVVFGQYVDALKLVKIHQFLDSPFFPEYFVEFIVYHEMLHHVVPGYVDGKGYYRCHGPEFKRREREFSEYIKATRWEKAHREEIFHGRT